MHNWSPLIALLVIAMVVALVVQRRKPPELQGAPLTEFSGERAFQVLERIVGVERPHPVGSGANEAVRERIVRELETLGLEVEQQRTAACRGTHCAKVVNLIARIDGRQQGPAVLLASHYDSVYAGPGVADDLHAVAIAIETVRALVARERRPRYPVMLLINEGEEVGLLGATAFVREPSSIERVATVVNVEARGSSGLSSMFETSDRNAALVRAFIEAVPRPRATSLAYEVYRRMPNRTDLSVFKEHSLAGLNFAFMAESAHYHTPLDNLANLDRGSLQHQGESVFATVTALAERQQPMPAAANLVYADVLGFFVLAWPEAWTASFAVVLFAWLLALVLGASRRRQVRLGRCAIAMGAALLFVLVVMVLGLGLERMVSAIQGEALPAYAHLHGFRIALWSMVALVAIGFAARLRSWVEPLELALGVWLWWACVALVLAATVPGVTVQWTAPMAVACVGLTCALYWPRQQLWGVLVGAAATTVLWADVALELEDAFGFRATPLLVAPLGVIATALLPCLMARRAVWAPLTGATLLLMISATAWSCVLPVYDRDHPRRVSITHHEDRRTHTAVDALHGPDRIPYRLMAVAAFRDQRQRLLPWMPPLIHAASSMTDAPAPTLEDGRYRSPRGAQRAVLEFPAGSVESVHVEGHALPVRPTGRTTVMLFGVPPEGLRVDVRGGEGGEVIVTDCSSTLPEVTRRLAEARGPMVTPFRDGDRSCITTSVVLEPDDRAAPVD